jgi:hypothetical protein
MSEMSKRKGPSVLDLMKKSKPILSTEDTESPSSASTPGTSNLADVSCTSSLAAAPSTSNVVSNFVDVSKLNQATFQQKAEAKRILAEFLGILIESVDNAFSPNRDLLSAFRIFDPYQWPKKSAELDDFGNEELDILIDHYRDLFTGPEVTELRSQWSSFKRAFQVEALKSLQECDDFQAAQPLRVHEAGRISLGQYGLETEEDDDSDEEFSTEHSQKAEKDKCVFTYQVSKKFFENPGFKAAFQPCLKLLEIYLCLPVSVAHVERMHSKMKLVKTGWDRD